MILLCILLAFLSLGALFGGGTLIFCPDGSMLGMPISILEHSVLFSDFLIPGILLLVVFGIFPAFLIWALVRKPDLRWFERLNIYRDLHWSWTFTLYVAWALIMWIGIQVWIIEGAAFIHIFYLAIAIAIIGVALRAGVRGRMVR